MSGKMQCDDSQDYATFKFAKLPSSEECITNLYVIHGSHHTVIVIPEKIQQLTFPRKRESSLKNKFRVADKAMFTVLSHYVGDIR
jgi:hypothetical protein